MNGSSPRRFGPFAGLLRRPGGRAGGARLALLGLALIAGASLARAVPINGQWQGKFTPPDGSEDITLTFKFKAEGRRLTGAVTGPQGDLPISRGTIQGDEIAFEVVVDGQPILHRAKVGKDWIQMQIQFAPKQRPVAMTLQRLDDSGDPIVLSPSEMAAAAPPAPAAAKPADPNGFWLWTLALPNQGSAVVEMAELSFKQGVLSGWRRSNQGPRLPIARASFENGVIAFTVRTDEGDQLTVEYRGKLTGDTISGTVEFSSDTGSPPLTVPWNASRSE